MVTVKIIELGRFINIPNEVKSKITNKYTSMNEVFVSTYDNEDFNVYSDKDKKSLLTTISVQKEWC